MKLGLIEIFTPDLAEARRFYAEILGLKLAAETADQLIFDLAGLELYVFRCVRAGRQEHGADAATVCAFEVDAIEAAMDELRSKGVRFLHAEPATNVLGAVRYAAFEAPGGNVHELIERTRPGRGR